MLINIFVLIGAGVSALLGAGVANTDVGRKMESSLEDAVNSIKRIKGKG